MNKQEVTKDDILQAVNSGFTDMQKQLNGLENRFDGLENRFDGLENNFNNFRQETTENFTQVHQDIAGLRRDLNIVEDTAESSKGFSKEIDFLFKEVKTIKKHLGLTTA